MEAMAAVMVVVVQVVSAAVTAVVQVDLLVAMKVAVAAECADQDRAEVVLNDQNVAIDMRAKVVQRDVPKVELSPEQRDIVLTDQLRALIVLVQVSHKKFARLVVHLLTDHVCVIAVTISRVAELRQNVAVLTNVASATRVKH